MTQKTNTTFCPSVKLFLIEMVWNNIINNYTAIICTKSKQGTKVKN